MNNCCRINNNSIVIGIGCSALVHSNCGCYSAYQAVYPLNTQPIGDIDEVEDKTRNLLHGTEYTPDFSIQDTGVFCNYSNYFNDGASAICKGDYISEQPITVSLWVNIDADYLPRVMFDRGNFTIGYDYLNYPYVTIRQQITEYSFKEITLTADTALDKNNFYYVAFVYDLTTLKIYINGEEDTTLTITNNNLQPYLDENYIGRDINKSGYMIGNLQEIRLSGDAKSAAWIKAEYDQICDGINFYTYSGEVVVNGIGIADEVAPLYLLLEDETELELEDEDFLELE